MNKFETIFLGILHEDANTASGSFGPAAAAAAQDPTMQGDQIYNKGNSLPADPASLVLGVKKRKGKKTKKDKTNYTFPIARRQTAKM